MTLQYTKLFFHYKIWLDVRNMNSTSIEAIVQLGQLDGHNMTSASRETIIQLGGLHGHNMILQTERLLHKFFLISSKASRSENSEIESEAYISLFSLLFIISRSNFALNFHVCTVKL